MASSFNDHEGQAQTKRQQEKTDEIRVQIQRFHHKTVGLSKI